MCKNWSSRRAGLFTAIVVAAAMTDCALAQTPEIRPVALSGQPAPNTPSGVVYEDFNPFYSSLNDAGHVAFLASVTGPNVGGSNEGIWSEGTGALALVARKGDLAPGAHANLRFESFLHTVLNNAGRTAFQASLTNFISGGIGIWSDRSGSLEKIVDSGSQVPGMGNGATFVGFGGGVFNDSGRSVFRGDIAGTVLSDNEGIWSEGSGSLALVAREGGHAAGMPPGFIFDVFGLPVLNDLGQTAFYAYVVGENLGVDYGQGVWSEQAGPLALVARSGAPAPGAQSGVNFLGFADLALNNAGQTAFWAYLDTTNPGAGDSYDDGIWSEGSGSLELVARRGGPAPDMPAGVHFGDESLLTFDSPVLNDSGQIAFRGFVSGAGIDETNDEGIWQGDADNLALVAQAGRHAPGAPSGVAFDAFGPLQLNEVGQVAFSALLIDEALLPFSGDQGIWATDRVGDLQLIARTGDDLEIAPGDFRKIMGLTLVGEMTGNSDGRPSGINRHGQIAFWARFEGGQGIFVSNRVAVPEPGTFALVVLGLSTVAIRSVRIRHRALMRMHHVVVALPLVFLASDCRADIYQWEYIDPANPSQGKRQSTTLAPDGADADLVPGAFLPGRNLTKAYLIGAFLGGYFVDGGEFSQGYYVFTNLSGTNLTQADLTNATVYYSTLNSANFTNAEIRGAQFDSSDFAAAQLYATASYQAQDLSRLSLGYNNLTNWNLANQNLAAANFAYATLTGANFTNAVVCGATFDRQEYLGGTGISTAQLASTASYQLHDLTGIGLAGNMLSGANFSGQNLATARFQYATLANANFYQANLTNGALNGATLTGANLNQANLTGANFSGATLTGATFSGAEVRGASISSISAAQLYATASYQAHNLAGIGLGGANLAGADFTSQNLTNAGLGGAALANANFSQAILANAYFGGATLTNANFSQVDLTNVSFRQASLTGATFTGAHIRGADFTDYGAGGISKSQIYSTASYQAHDLAGIKLSGNDFKNGNFSGQDLSHADLSLSTSSNANFSQANLEGADFYGANVTNANLSQASLKDADLKYAHLSGASLVGANVQGANFYRQADPSGDYGSGLTVAQLQSTASYQAHDLRGIGLTGSNLPGVNLAGQDLTAATFGDVNSHADLTGATLLGANLTNATLSYTTLQNANLSHSNLTNATLRQANLTGANLTGAEVRRANFSHNYNSAALTLEQLYSTLSYQTRDLSGINLGGIGLIGADFADQALTNATFADGSIGGSNLAGADFSRADLTNVFFANSNLAGATFASANLTGARLGHEDSFYGGADLTGANFSHANLANANFAGALIYDEFGGSSSVPGANLTNANLSGADSRGARFEWATLVGVNSSNLIHSDGHILGLNLTNDSALIVRDYDGNQSASPPVGSLPIIVEQQAMVSATGTLRLEFDADSWDSTISFAAGIPVALGGTLELTFAAGTNPVAQIGRVIDLFDWQGVTPTGAFQVASPHGWDLSRLYTTGEVILTTVAGQISGDFSGDGVVDAADLASWKAGFGTLEGATRAAGDADRDGDVDGADFLAWQRQFDLQAPTAAVAALVPEPGAATLILLIAGAVLLTKPNSLAKPLNSLPCSAGESF